MMWNPFARLAARSRLRKARREYEAALIEHKMACERKDSRRIHQATGWLQEAHRKVLAAEIVAFPQPPMPRHAVKGN